MFWPHNLHKHTWQQQQSRHEHGGDPCAHNLLAVAPLAYGTAHPLPVTHNIQHPVCVLLLHVSLHHLQAAPRMSPAHLQRMQALRAAGIAKHGKSPALGVPRRAAADCTIDEGSYVRVRGATAAA